MDKAEILRYLRTNSKIEDERVLGLVDECCQIAQKSITPKTLYRIFDCSVTEDTLICGGFEFKSKRLAKNLEDCKRVVVFGATLGRECDEIIRRYSLTDIAKAMTFQAVFAAMIEEVCDGVEDEVRAVTGKNLRMRYSPGYFDLAIENQEKIFKMLELTKRIGLTLTQTMQMLPTKSVTAFIGIED